MSNPKIEMGCSQLALGADIGIHTGAFTHPDAYKKPRQKGRIYISS